MEPHQELAREELVGVHGVEQLALSGGGAEVGAAAGAPGLVGLVGQLEVGLQGFFLGSFGVGLFWVCFGFVLGLFWVCFGFVLGLIWVQFGCGCSLVGGCSWLMMVGCVGRGRGWAKRG